jgi:hypothetical protein
MGHRRRTRGSREEAMMKSGLISVFGIGSRAKICCAVAVSASLIFAGSICAKAEDAKAEDCKQDDTWCNVKQVASGAKDVTDYFTAAKTAVEMVKLVDNIFNVGLFKKGPDPLDRVTDAIQRAFEGNIWFQINDALGRSVAVADSLIAKIRRKDPIDEKDNTDADLAVREITNDFTTSAVFSFPYNEKAQKRGIEFLHYIKKDLDPRSEFIYDWRLGISALMRVISVRLVVLAAFHPNFRNDGYGWTDLNDYREALKIHYETMLKGVRCATKTYETFAYDTYGRFFRFPKEIDRCADIHTGLSTGIDRAPACAEFWKADENNRQPGCARLAPLPLCQSDDTWNLFWDGVPLSSTSVCAASPETAEEVLADLKREVIRSMPLYEVKAMIDTLYLLTHPMSDLTAQHQRIPSYVTPSLCLEAKGEANGAELQLWTCDNDPLQHWVYYRASGHIRNPDIGKCLEISYAAPASGQNFPVSISECFGDEWQRWTYDPETHVLLSAMGPVLTIGTNTHQSKDWLAELIQELFFPRAGDPVSSSPLLLSGKQIVFHAENNETVYPKQQWLADKAPPVVCKPKIKQITPLVGSGLPNC